MLTFYFAPGSSSMAVHIALHETGAPFEARPMSFATHDMRKPEFLAINPNGKVPTLLIDGRVLTEVAGILFYLARTHPQANLLPTNDPEAEARTQFHARLTPLSAEPSLPRTRPDTRRTNDSPIRTNSRAQPSRGTNCLRAGLGRSPAVIGQGRFHRAA